MARLRPARTMRIPNSQAWARFSRKKPRKNFVRTMPHTSLLVFNMGVKNESYDLEVTLNPEQAIQIRSNSIESARLVTNKFLESEIPQQYMFKVVVYPHIVIREHKMATGAGADRTSQGMKTNTFGRPVSIAARVVKGQPIFMIRTSRDKRDVAVKAMRRAASKLSGTYKVKAKELQARAAQAPAVAVAAA